MATDSNPNKRKKRAPSIKKPYLTEEECDSIKHVLLGAGAGAIRAARRVGGRRAAGPRRASTHPPAPPLAPLGGVPSPLSSFIALLPAANSLQGACVICFGWLQAR